MRHLARIDDRKSFGANLHSPAVNLLTILAIVTLGYLGLGVQPPTADWGKMIADGQTYLTTHWELSTIPGIAVVITALGLSLLADGLADLLRPE